MKTSVLKDRVAAHRMVFAASFALLLICLFWLPYRVATTPSLSDSYLFGFNNRVCWFCFLILMGAVASFGPNLSLASQENRTLSPQALRKALLGTLLASGFMYVWTRKLNGFDESIYLIDRVRLVLEGHRPYRDFESAYGAGFLYLPAMLARITHLGAADAYGVVYIVAALAGTFLLDVCLGWMEGPDGAKRKAFWFVWTISSLSTLNCGLNYSLLRYLLPIFWMLLIHRAVSANSKNDLQACLLIPLGYALTLLDSPELAVALAVGSSVYLLRRSRLRLLVNYVNFGFMAALIAGLTVLAYRIGVFNTLLAFRTGGFNFPVTPAPHVLLFICAASITACRAGTEWRAGHHGTVLPLYLFGLVASAAALGRCDPGHILLNGLPFFLCAILLADTMRPPWRALTPLLWLVFVLIPLLRGLPSILNGLGKAALPTVFAMERGDHLSRFDIWVYGRMKRQLGPELAAEKFAEYRMAAHHSPELDLDALFGQKAGTQFEAPYGFSVTHFGLYHTSKVNEGYFFEMINVVTPEQVTQKIGELRAHPERPLLLLPGREDACHVSAVGERNLISSMFLFPYRARVAHGESLSEPLCAYIHKHYFRTVPADATHFGYSLWSPFATD